MPTCATLLILCDEPCGAGRGKGIVTLGSILPDAVQRYLEDKNKTVQSEYDKKQLAWALEERLAIQEKRVPDIDKRPEPPVKRMLRFAQYLEESVDYCA